MKQIIIEIDENSIGTRIPNELSRDELMKGIKGIREAKRQLDFRLKSKSADGMLAMGFTPKPPER